MLHKLYFNNLKINKFLFISITCLVFILSTITSASASDYQYKILDPKYNPQAAKIIDGQIPPVTEIKPIKNQSGFDFGTFFALCALIAFPTFIISLAFRTFKEISEDIPGRQKQIIGNIKIEKKHSGNVVQESNTNKSATDTITKPRNRAKLPSIQPATSALSPKKKLPGSANSSINKYFSSPMPKIPNPMLLNTSVLSNNKGLCLVEYNKKYSLIGYIDDEIFMLNQSESVDSNEIRSRLSESNELSDRYIVRLGGYKALVEVSETKMDLILEL